MYDIFGGVLYDLDISQPVGQRITNLRWPNGSFVQDSDTVTLALNDYRAQTTLISELFPNGEVVLVRDLYQEMGDEGKAQQLLMRYIQEVLGENFPISSIQSTTSIILLVIHGIHNYVKRLLH